MAQPDRPSATADNRGARAQGRPLAGEQAIERLIGEEIPAKVAADPAYTNARARSDRQNARIEHDKALGRVMTSLLKDDTELFRQFSNNESFRQWLLETVFALAYQPPAVDAA